MAYTFSDGYANSGRLFGMATTALQVEGGIAGTDWELFAGDPEIGRQVCPNLFI